MPRADWSRQLDEIRRSLDPEHRYVDVGFQFEVYGCSCGQPHVPQDATLQAARAHLEQLKQFKHRPVAKRLLPEVYGGRYDNLLCEYAGPCRSDVVKRIPCHEGQAELLTFTRPGVIRVLALGSPGAGKSVCAELRGLRHAIERPNSMGAIIGPTRNDRRRLWKEFLTLVRAYGFIREARKSDFEVELLNGSVVLLLAAKASSAQEGSPLQGYSLDWAVVDESQSMDDSAHEEIVARGRSAGKKFVIFETATNSNQPRARVRRERLKRKRATVIMRFHGFANPWIKPWWWRKLLDEYTERRYREFILAEDVPPELLLYPQFSYEHNVKVLPRLEPGGWVDITEQVAYEVLKREGVKYLVGQDFGVVTNASVVCKVLRSPQGARTWWAIDEVTTRNASADMHARQLLARYSAADLAVVADPHFNSKDEDKSDYNLFRREGLWITPATYGQIAREHRITTVNLLCNDVGRRRFFVVCDKNGTPACQRLVQALMSLERNELGQAERDRKDATDMTHWPAALGYLVYGWEKVASVAQPGLTSGTAQVKKFGSLAR